MSLAKKTVYHMCGLVRGQFSSPIINGLTNDPDIS